jgi:integrase
MDRFVASVRATSRKNYFDTKAKGLTLRVSPSGAKTWHFVYRVNGKGSQWITLGTYPAVKLAEARKQALNHRHAVDVEGRDPAAELRAAKLAATLPPEPAPKVFTFDDLAKLYVTFAKGRKKTWKDDELKIEKYLRPAWGSLALRDVKRTHVHELLDTLVAQGMTVGVNRVQAVISRMFTLALDRSLIDAHPAARMMKRFAERPADRVLTDDELRALWVGLDARPGRAADAIRLRMLLGQRGDEVIDMEWAEVDLQSAVWELPARRTKNGRPHAVPLAATALQVLKTRREQASESDVRVFGDLSRWTDDYRALAAIHDGAYVWKDLRRTVGTRLAGLGFSTTTIGRVLNHAAVVITEKHYIKHLYLAEKRAALEAWDRELQRIIEQKEASKKVLPFATA